MKCPKCKDGEMSIRRSFWSDVFLQCEECGYQDYD